MSGEGGARWDWRGAIGSPACLALGLFLANPGASGQVVDCNAEFHPGQVQIPGTPYEWHCRAAMGFCGHRITVRAGFAG